MIFGKGSFLFLSLILFIGTTQNCNGRDHEELGATKIRLINNSNLSFTQVALFSKPFEHLEPKDTTEYVELIYDPLRDDPMLYCVFEGKNLGRYVEIPEKGIRNASYVIQDLRDGVLYVDFKVEIEN